MDKKPKRENDIPRPEKDVRIDKTEPKFNAALSAFVKTHTKKPKSNDDSGN
ncbi:hypothetical protein KIH23_10295 [Flavobacterium sp. CYK-55]|uniref:hypothetical protein n=1 Tax=Flavobacterium sp. CYK-55 TaxID=2835529 RepID=UPI001BCFA8AC|nr:hypothetical protein [Flavobacterium sp. CYK-55]MBS7787688.1 hypothetical protein [Flavobacterium sp. CYK-55]